jgi:hypothetical protein
MIIKLFQPPARNWLLIAEDLKDPDTWDRFVPTHSPNSERFAFDKVVAQTAGNSITLKVYKDLLKRGSSAYEYAWDTDQEIVISHALNVADALGADLEIAEPSQKTA